MTQRSLLRYKVILRHIIICVNFDGISGWYYFRASERYADRIPGRKVEADDSDLAGRDTGPSFHFPASNAICFAVLPNVSFDDSL